MAINQVVLTWRPHRPSSYLRLHNDSLWLLNNCPPLLNDLLPLNSNLPNKSAPHLSSDMSLNSIRRLTLYRPLLNQMDRMSLPMAIRNHLLELCTLLGTKPHPP